MSTTATKGIEHQRKPAISFNGVLCGTRCPGLLPDKATEGIPANRSVGADSDSSAKHCVSPAIAVYDFTMSSDNANVLTIPPCDSGINMPSLATTSDEGQPSVTCE